MIRFRDQVYDDYFIDEHTAEITDVNGNVIKPRSHQNGYLWVYIHKKGMPIHQIQAHTKWGYHSMNDVHHKDDNKQNNDIDNLDYSMSHEKHAEITMKGKPKSEIHKKHMSECRIGKHPSEETRKNMSESHKGQIPWNKGMTYTLEERHNLKNERKRDC